MIPPDQRDYLDRDPLPEEEEIQAAEDKIMGFLGAPFSFDAVGEKTMVRLDRVLAALVTAIPINRDYSEDGIGRAQSTPVVHLVHDLLSVLHLDPGYRFTALAREAFTLCAMRSGDRHWTSNILWETTEREFNFWKDKPKDMAPPFLLSPRLAWRAASLDSEWKPIFDKIEEANLDSVVTTPPQEAGENCRFEFHHW